MDLDLSRGKGKMVSSFVVDSNTKNPQKQTQVSLYHLRIGVWRLVSEIGTKGKTDPKIGWIATLGLKPLRKSAQLQMLHCRYKLGISML